MRSRKELFIIVVDICGYGQLRAGSLRCCCRGRAKSKGMMIDTSITVLNICDMCSFRQLVTGRSYGQF